MDDKSGIGNGDPNITSPIDRALRYQRVLNASWPADAARIKDRPNPVPVRVLLHFEHDGPTQLDGLAIRWDDNHRHVCVNVDDDRLQVALVWVAFADTEAR